MTPKDKAKELVDKFEVNCAGIISNSEDWETLAKESALIAVDLAIEVETNIFKGKVHKSYWNEVKNEIEKL